MSHWVVEKGDEQLPTIRCDYGFFGKATYLVAKDKHAKLAFSYIAPAQGVEDPRGAKKLLADVHWTGYKRLILKSDQ